MTIKVRNRLNLTIFILSLIFLIFAFVFIGYQHIYTNFSLPEVYLTNQTSSNFLFGYNPYVVILSILFELFYAVLVLFLVRRNFFKTQSSIVLFFITYLTGCVFDSFRILIPLFHISGTFSQALLIIGDTSLFGRLLSTFSLMMIALFTLDDQPVQTDRNLLLLIVFSLFVAAIIPMNTAKILPTFNVSYGYSHIVFILIIIVEVLSVFTVFITNYRNESSQLQTLGFALLIAGYMLLIYTTNLFMLIIAYILLGVGTGIYMFQLHNNYLWR